MHIRLGQKVPRWAQICKFASRSALQWTLGRYEEQAGWVDCYAFWRTFIKGLFAGHHTPIDAKLEAVRLSTGEATAKWVGYGGRVVTDPDGSTTVELLDEHLTEQGRQAIVQDGALIDVQEGFWVLKGNYADMLPIHPKDLWPRKVPTSCKEWEVASFHTDASTTTDDRSVLAAWIASLRALRDEVQSVMLEHFRQQGGEHSFRVAHAIPLTRSKTLYDTLFLRREQCHELKGYSPGMSIDGAGNVFLLHTCLSISWEARELFFMPYPNAGWLAPGKPRPMDAPMDEVKVIRTTSIAGTPRFEMPPAAHLQLCIRNHYARTYVEKAKVEFDCFPRQAVAGVPEPLRNYIRVPAAAFLYVAVAQIGSQLITDELRAEIGKLVTETLGESEDVMEYPSSEGGDDDDDDDDA